MSQMIVNNVQPVMVCVGQGAGNTPIAAQMVIYNNEVIWPKGYSHYIIDLEWYPTKNENITLDGMGWGTSIGFIHSENIEWMDYTSDGTNWTDYTTTEIINATTDNGSSVAKYCRQISVCLKASSLGDFTAFCFKTDTYYQPTGTIRVSVWGVPEQAGMSNVLLAQKDCSMTMNTLYTINVGETV